MVRMRPNSRVSVWYGRSRKLSSPPFRCAPQQVVALAQHCDLITQASALLAIYLMLRVELTLRRFETEGPNVIRAVGP